MKHYTKEEIIDILKLHKMWEFGKERGKRADLRGAYLQGADLQGAYLRNADLQGAYLRNADLRNADLRGAYLQGADLRNADLQGADLRNADLRGAYLRGAYLRNKIKAKSKKTAAYVGSDYYCVFVGSIIKIGCEVYYRSKWEHFTDKEILKMDGKKALKFWRKEKQTVLKISKNLSR